MSRKIIFLALLLLFPANFAYAAPITVNFTANDFSILAGSNQAPTDPVTGTIVYDATDVYSPINSLTSITMTIDGHAYAVGELAFISPWGSEQLIGGAINGADGTGGANNDFWLNWYTATLTPDNFTYTDALVPGIWRSVAFSQFSVTGPGGPGPAPVPEPATMLLLGSGIVGLAATRARRRTQ